MDDQEIIKKFLDLGMQITNDALIIVRKDPEFFISEIKKLKIRPFFLTKDIVNEIIAKKEKEPNFEIVKQISFEKKPLRIDDYINFYLKKYELLRDIFVSTGFSAISINKINERTKEFSTIGLIREKKNSSITIEDPTGEIELFFEGIMKQRLQEFDVDDVICIKAEKSKDKFVVKKIMHADIPLNREVKKTNEEILLKINFDESNPLLPKKYSSPTVVKFFEISFLIIPKTFFDIFEAKIDLDEIIKLLKKRFLLPKTKDVAIANPEDFILKDLPDFIITDVEPSGFKNYKGTTIISVFDKEYEVNLHTREVKEI